MSKQKMCREKIGENIFFSAVSDKKFRHNSLTVNIIAPLDAEKASATAILPSLLRRSSKKYPDFTALEKELCNLYGASLSSDISKIGSNIVLSFSILFIDDNYTLNKEIIQNRCASLLCDTVLYPKIENGEFDADEFELERKNLIDTIEAEMNDKRQFSLERCKEMLYENTDYAVPKYGTLRGACELTSKQAAERYRELIKTARIEITFVGCGNPEYAKKSFEKEFSTLERISESESEPPKLMPAGEVKEKKCEMEVVQGKLVLGFNLDGRNNSAKDVNAVKLMSIMYGGTPSAKLFVNVREKLSLCYYCAARYDRFTDCITVDSGIEIENKEKAQNAILHELKQLADGNFTEQEIFEAKMAFMNSLRTVGDSLSAIENFYLTQILLGTDETPESMIEAINAVTAEEVSEAAKRVKLDSIFFLTGKERSSE